MKNKKKVIDPNKSSFNSYVGTLKMTLRKLKHFVVTNRHFVSERVLDAQKSLDIYTPNQSFNIESSINSESNTINEK